MRPYPSTSSFQDQPERAFDDSNNKHPRVLQCSRERQRHHKPSSYSRATSEHKLRRCRPIRNICRSASPVYVVSFGCVYGLPSYFILSWWKVLCPELMRVIRNKGAPPTCYCGCLWACRLCVVVCVADLGRVYLHLFHLNRTDSDGEPGFRAGGRWRLC